MNVWGDSVGCGVVEALTQKQLDEMDDDIFALDDNRNSKPAPITYDNSAYDAGVHTNL